MDRLTGLSARLFRGAAEVLSSGRHAKLLVLMFHRVPEFPDELDLHSPCADEFEEQLRAIREVFQPFTFGEGMRRMAAGCLPPRAVAITFDDGYANNRTIAAPILTKLCMPATFFVSTGYLNGGRMWNDTVIEAVRNLPDKVDLNRVGLGLREIPDLASRRQLITELLSYLKYLPSSERERRSEWLAECARASLPDNLMMTSEQVSELTVLGMEVGAHTVTHPILANLDDSDAEREIRSCKRTLEDIVGCTVTSFAYPNGRPGRDYKRRHAEMAKSAGFLCAASTAWGCVRHGLDPYQAPRISPWDKSPELYALRMLRTYLQPSPQLA